MSIVAFELSAPRLAVPELLVVSSATKADIFDAFKTAPLLTIKLSVVAKSVIASVPETM